MWGLISRPGKLPGISDGAALGDRTAFPVCTATRRARAVYPVRDPLAEARRFLDAHGETGEGQALRRVLKTLATGAGDFDESEVWLFSAETLALVSALVEARLEGLYPDGEWWR